MRPGPWARAALVTAAVAFLPFLRPMLAGQAFYFRDLSILMMPTRLYALDGLRHGELRFWNPFVNEGNPAYLPPVSYLPELLTLLHPDERGLSVFLALHVPLAALAFLLLLRELRAGPAAATLGALVYALGGFALSMLNFYMYLPAVAWAPAVILTVARACAGGARAVVLAALALAVAVSTCGAELALQAGVLGVVLGAARPLGRGLARVAAAALLAGALAAPSIVAVAAMTAAGDRGQGLDTDVVLAHSLHPATLGQVAIAAWHGDPARGAEAWWGARFFSRGFPYAVSLYLGAAALALAFVGAAQGGSAARRLTLLAALALWIALGRFAGWRPVVDALPFLRVFRFPVKAFFTVHVAVAALAALGLQAMLDSAAARRRLAIASAALGALAIAAGLVLLASGAARAALLPEGTPAAASQGIGAVVAGDAAVGGAVALALGALAFLVGRGRLRPPLAAAIVVALVAADLVRGNGALNPTVTPAFFRLSPESEALAARLRNTGGRTYVCHPLRSPAYWTARAAHADYETWTFAVVREMLLPQANLGALVPTALGDDLVGFTVPGATLPPDMDCRDFGRLVGRLQDAGVKHVISADALTHPALTERAVVAPARIAPLTLHEYDLAGSRPFLSVVDEKGADVPLARAFTVRRTTDRQETQVATPRPARLRVLENFAAGWSATLDRTPTPAPVTRTNDGRIAVAVPAGSHTIVLQYRVRGMRVAVGATLLGLLACAWLWSRHPSPYGERGWGEGTGTLTRATRDG